jgi:hypothetical protein
MQHPNNNSGVSSRYNPNGTVSNSMNNTSQGGGSISPAIGGSLPPEMMSQNARNSDIIGGLPSAFTPNTQTAQQKRA